MVDLEIAGGSVPGKTHRHIGKNNQDAYVWQRGDELIVAVVADGCGSGKYSEIGSHIGVLTLSNLIAETASRNAGANFADAESWRAISASYVQALQATMPATSAEFVRDYFLHTLVGAVIIRDMAHFFSYGDGLIVVNDEVITIGPFAGNAPPYIMYECTPTSGINRDDLHFTVHRSLPVCELKSFIVGTDGLSDLFKIAEPTEFTRSDVVFCNMDKVRRMLWMRREELPDDTTLIVGRKINQEDADAERLS